MRHGLAACLLLLLLPLPAAAAEGTGLAGSVLDPWGKPFAGARVLVEDQQSRALFTSAPTSPAGEYSLELPPGRRYQIVGVLSPEGVRFGLREGAALPSPLLTRHHADIELRENEAAPKPAQDAAKAWYKRPAGIATIVAVHVAAIAIILAGNDEEPASPF